MLFSTFILSRQRVALVRPAIRAFNNEGDEASNVVSITAAALSTTPTTRTDVMAHDNTDGTASISLVDTSDNETGFEVRLKNHIKKANAILKEAC